MDALISGTTGRALLVDSGQLRSFDVDDPSKLVPRTASDFPYLFGEMHDLRVVENTNIESARQELQHESDSALALDLALISLDAELPEQIRKEALEGLNDLIEDDRIVKRLESILYARPLPEDADINEALRLCAGPSMRNTQSWLQRLEEYQPLINEVSGVWDSIPTKLFGSYDHQSEFQRIAAQEGLFRSLVVGSKSRDNISAFLLKAGLNQSVRKLHNYRQVLQRWAHSFQRSGDISVLMGDSKERSMEYLFSHREYYAQIYKQVFEKTDSTRHAHGLLVVAGSGESERTEIARGLIDLYLTNKRTEERRPHLVTFEDPIERPHSLEDIQEYRVVTDELTKEWRAIYHTARLRQKNDLAVEETLAHALRQTPTVFYVGEVREQAEWELLVGFGASGHLVVTTSEADSLPQAMHKIFAALRVKLPAQRADIASKLLGVIHLRNSAIEVGARRTRMNARLPTLWRRTPQGVALLAADGLASLLPASNRQTDAEPVSYIGCRWLIDQLLGDLDWVFEVDKREIRKQILEKATEWDLQSAILS